MLSRPSMVRADSSEQLEASFEQIDPISTPSDISLSSSEEETAVDEDLLQSAKVDLVVSPSHKKDSEIDDAIIVRNPHQNVPTQDDIVKNFWTRKPMKTWSMKKVSVEEDKIDVPFVKKDSGVVIDMKKGDVVFNPKKKTGKVVKKDAVDVKKDKKKKAGDQSESLHILAGTQTMEEHIVGLESRLLSVINANHQVTMDRICAVEARLEERINGIEEKTLHATDKIHVELVELEKRERESNEAILNTLRSDMAQINHVGNEEESAKDVMDAKPEEVKKEKCSTARACEVARKNAIECLDKIKSKCKNLRKTSSVAEDAVSVAAEAQADAIDEKEIKEERGKEDYKNLETILLTKPVIKLAFREGSRGAKCWVVDEIIRDTPYRLRKGDEIVTIDGVDATTIPHSRISKLMGSFIFPKKCYVGIRRCGVVETKEKEEKKVSSPIPIPALVQ